MGSGAMGGSIDASTALGMTRGEFYGVGEISNIEY